MKAVRLRTEYLKDPIGIDIKKPLLMWNAEGGVLQTAYEIKTEKWESGRVESSSMRAEYPLDICSGERVSWSVRLYDEKGEPGEWSHAFFEAGLLFASDWKASWITGNYSVNKKERYPVDSFRKQFTVRKDISRARLYITACGLYEASIGGKKVGDFFMAPGYTDYRKRIQYQTYDVKDMLMTGENELTVLLADGWYRGSCGAWGIRNQYGSETKLLVQLEIEYGNGEKDLICTDSSWDWSSGGPIRFADNKDGETVEAFRSPVYTAKAKQAKHNVVPSASNNVPVKEHERFHPVISTSPNGKMLLDFGQNMAGIVSFKTNGHIGEKMVWRFGELLDSEGNLTQKNIQLSTKKKTTPLQKIEYTCCEGLNEYKTKFAVFGFRYAEVETDLELDPREIEAIAVYSDMEQTGFFESSNELLNSFFDATLWSAKGNHLDIPTDCPTRERHGWTGDAQIFAATASYLFEYMPFARKYLRDVYDWQKKDGKLPQIAPEGGTDFYMASMNGCVGWADAGIIIPYVLWKQYGDKKVLEEYWEGMKRYAAFQQSRCGKFYPTAKKVTLSAADRKYLNNCGQGYGEWAEPQDVNPQSWKTCVITHPETATAYTAYTTDLMAEMAEVMGENKLAEEYRDFAKNNRKSYQALMRSKEYSLDTDRQAQLVRALKFRMLDEGQTKYAEDRLIKALENYGWRLGTGFLSTPLILSVLEGIDKEAAYRLLENEEIPGWLSMPKNGATTIWEAWEGPNTLNGGIGSLNHYSKGAVCEWLFSSMCGIKAAGENRFEIKPLSGGNFSFAKAAWQSPYGKVESSWSKDGGKTVYTVSVPANCNAHVVLPDGREYEQSAGTCEYTAEE